MATDQGKKIQNETDGQVWIKTRKCSSKMGAGVEYLGNQSLQRNRVIYKWRFMQASDGCQRR